MKITEIGGDGGAEESRELVPASAKRALVGAGARVLFYPTLLYNVLRCMMEPEFRWWDEVDQFLLLGAVPFPKDVPRLRLLGVGGVVTLNEPYETLVPSSLYKDYGIDHLVIPTRDYLFAPSLVDICRGVDFIHKNASCGKATYVHCKAGRGRSTTIVLCYLVKYKHMTPTAALEHVRSIRPRVLLAPSQWQAIQEFSKQKTDCLAIENWSPINPPTGDAVLVTDSDLEGYNTGDDTFEDVCDPSHGFLTFEEDPSHGFLTFEEDVCDPSHGFLPVRSVTWSHMPSSPAMDMVLVTDADLEGYGVGDDACVDMNIATYKGIIRARPTIGRLSCLFSSLKISSSCQSVARRPPEIRAC